jgi:hypothetical protein
MKANATFRQPEDALNLPLARRDSGIAPKIKLAASRELFFRGLASHEITLLILPESHDGCNMALPCVPFYAPLQISDL